MPTRRGTWLRVDADQKIAGLPRNREVYLEGAEDESAMEAACKACPTKPHKRPALRELTSTVRVKVYVDGKLAGQALAKVPEHLTDYVVMGAVEHVSDPDYDIILENYFSNLSKKD